MENVKIQISNREIWSLSSVVAPTTRSVEASHDAAPVSTYRPNCLQDRLVQLGATASGEVSLGGLIVYQQTIPVDLSAATTHLDSNKTVR